MNATLAEETNLWNQTSVVSGHSNGQTNTPYIEITLIASVVIVAGLSSAAIFSYIKKKNNLKVSTIDG